MKTIPYLALLLTVRMLAAGPLADPSVAVSSSANDQLLYFTSTSLLADDKGIVFLSDRTGDFNIFHRDPVTGKDTQLTDNTDGFLKSYVYFDGTPNQGFGRASVSLDAKRGLVYYIQGREIRVVDLAGKERVLATYPENQMTAFTHVSDCGTRLCVPTVDARALDGDTRLIGKPPYNIDARVQAENLNSYLRIYDTATGKEIACEKVPQAWITHVQFSPVDPSLVLYNHEWPADCGIRRMWVWDGKKHLRLRPEGEGRSRDDWACHEMWERDGKGIIYHGSYHKGAPFIGRVNADGSGLTEISLPGEWIRYGHYTGAGRGWLVTDGNYSEAGDAKDGNGEWISVVQVDWKKRTYQWLPLCRSGSSWKSQDEHPHPIFNHGGDAVYFTSDKSGRRAIYRVAVPATEPNPIPAMQ